MPKKQRSKSKTNRTKNINWFIKQYILTIALVCLKDRTDVETHVKTSPNQADTFYETRCFIC